MAFMKVGEREIPVKKLAMLADFYNTSTDYLLYRTDEFTPYAKSRLYKKEIIKV